MVHIRYNSDGEEEVVERMTTMVKEEEEQGTNVIRDQSKQQVRKQRAVTNMRNQIMFAVLTCIRKETFQSLPFTTMLQMLP